ncbi:hypothetical protein AAVH_15194 [Aphelenchoides avenae]|nr:hypothetical protein AAVH_15194 [Aphelenchus avenae]
MSFARIVDLGNGICDDGVTIEGEDPTIIVEYTQGSSDSNSLNFYFMNTGHTDNVQDLFLLDYTISFGSMDRPRLEHRFLRIVEMVAPMSKQDFETKRNEERRSKTILLPKMEVFTANSGMYFRPYIVVKGTASAIYVPLKKVQNLLREFNVETDMKVWERILKEITLNGWRGAV